MTQGPRPKVRDPRPTGPITCTKTRASRPNDPRNYVSDTQLQIEKALRRTKKPAQIVPVTRRTAH
jgi:hypothetical protein